MSAHDTPEAAGTPRESSATGATSTLELRWPAEDPSYGHVRLRAFTVDREADDVRMAMAVSRDPYVPMISTLAADADEEQALAWVARQRERLAEGLGFSYCIEEGRTGEAVGYAGLWVRDLDAGRCTAGLALAPSARGRGLAVDTLAALTAFAWTIPTAYRVEAYIEPWNVGSWRAAERVGYQREGLLLSHQEIGGTRRDMYLYAALRPQPSRSRTSDQ